MSVNFCQTVRDRWPEAIRPLAERNNRFFPTGLSELDRIFPSGQGLPCGQLIEITGGTSSGKTSLLFRLLGGTNPTINGGPNDTCRQASRPDGGHAQASVGQRHPTPHSTGTPPLGVGSRQGPPRRRRVAYVDFGNTFFPDDTAGIDLSRLLVIKPHKQVKCRQASRTDGDGIGQRRPTPLNEVASVPAPRLGGACELTPATHSPLTSGLRAAELLLRDRHVEIVVFDLVGCRTPLPIGLIHRLRLKTVRARGLVIFLTETTALIPSSMASLRLEVERGDLADHYRITVTKSRLCAEGIRLEVAL